jgi:hypothetical protein
VTAELDAEIEKADHKLNDDPGLVPDEWMSYAVRRAKSSSGKAPPRLQSLAAELSPRWGPLGPHSVVAVTPDRRSVRQHGITLRK